MMKIWNIKQNVWQFVSLLKEKYWSFYVSNVFVLSLNRLVIIKNFMKREYCRKNCIFTVNCNC